MHSGRETELAYFLEIGYSIHNMTLFGLTLEITALRFSKEKAKAAHHYMERAVDYLQELVNDLNIDCDYEHPGFLRVATSEKYKKRILKEMELAMNSV